MLTNVCPCCGAAVPFQRKHCPACEQPLKKREETGVLFNGTGVIVVLLCMILLAGALWHFLEWKKAHDFTPCLSSDKSVPQSVIDAQREQLEKERPRRLIREYMSDLKKTF